MFQTKFIVEIKKHILCPVTFFFSENCAVYEIMKKNTVEAEKTQVTIQMRRMLVN